MWKVVVKDTHPSLDGEYPMTFEFTNRDLRTIKLMSGVRALEIEDALAAGDNDVLVALVAIGLKRAGKTFPDDALWDAPAGSLSLEDEDADASPPVEGSSPAQNEPNETSGTPSSVNGEPSPEMLNQNGSGTPGSDTGATSDQVTSAT